DVVLEHKNVVPVGGSVDYSSTDTQVSFSFTWDSVAASALSVQPDSSNDLVPLMYALHHHVESFTGTAQTVVPDCQARASHGVMKCVRGKTWNMQMDLPTFDFDFNVGFVDCGHKLSTKM